MVQWVQGDGLVTDEQIVKEVAKALGFQRVGNRIETAIRRAIDRQRRLRQQCALTAQFVQFEPRQRTG